MLPEHASEKRRVVSIHIQASSAAVSSGLNKTDILKGTISSEGDGPSEREREREGREKVKGKKKNKEWRNLGWQCCIH